MGVVYTQCPYADCNEEIELEIEGQNNYNTYKERCSKCEKFFEYNFEYSIDIYTLDIDGEYDKKETKRSGVQT